MYFHCKDKLTGERNGKTAMKCPYCAHLESKVVDSRPTDEGESIRRRRECLACQRRFTTYELLEILPIIVIKKDGSRQAFDKQKILNGLLRATEKRPISLGDLTKIVNSIELKLQNELRREVKSTEIGQLVMDELKNLDEVAYVRFASVYREFKDINSFMSELTSLLKKNENVSGTDIN
jgi:transcriptional repressor NrdR